MRKNSPILLLLLTLVAAGCSARTQEVVYVPIDINKLEHINGLEIHKGILTSNSFDIASEGKYIFLTAKIDDKMCHMYGTDGHHLSSICSFGKGPYDAMYMSNVSYNSDDSLIIISDMLQRKNIFFKLEADQSLVPTTWREIETKSYFLAVTTVVELDNNRTLYHGSVGRATDMERVRFSIENKQKSSINKYSKLPESKDSIQMGFAYEQANVITSPDKKKMAVIPSALAGIIEFFDISDDIKLKHINYVIEPTFTHNGQHITGIPEGAAYGFLDLCATNQFVYLSYVGNPTEEKQTSSIVVYDWNGNMVSGFRTDYTNYRISYNESDGHLYAMTTNSDNEHILVKYKI